MSCYNIGLLRAFGVNDRRRRLDNISEIVQYPLPSQHSTRESRDTEGSQHSNRESRDAEGSQNSTRESGDAEGSQQFTEVDENTQTLGAAVSTRVCHQDTLAPSRESGAIRLNNFTRAAQPELEIMEEGLSLEDKLRQFKEDCKTEDASHTQGSYNPGFESEKQRKRNLIFDEERFEETFLKCLICREVYNESDKLPKMLHCHHTFCLDCLFQMYRVEGEFRQSLTSVFRGTPMTVKLQCPSCREGLLISESELRRLPNDHTIMELLYFVSQTGCSDVQYCAKHQMQPLNFFCESCISAVCCDCTVLDHKESKGHVVVSAEEAMQKYTPIVEETLTDIECEKSRLAEKKETLESALEDLDQIQANLNEQIHAVFDQIREVLLERERELYDVSESEIERKRELLQGHLKVLLDRDSLLNSELKGLLKAQEDKDISMIVTEHRSARSTLSEPVDIPTDTTRGFSVTFQFSSRADALIKQQVKNLGDIIFQS